MLYTKVKTNEPLSLIECTVQWSSSFKMLRHCMENKGNLTSQSASFSVNEKFDLSATQVPLNNDGHQESMS